MGLSNSWMNGATLPAIDEGVIMRAWSWFNSVIKEDPRLAAGTYVLVEVMQKVGLRALLIGQVYSVH